MADTASADLVQLHCTAAPDVAAQRITSRTGGASDASPDVLTQLAAAKAPWPQAITPSAGDQDGHDRAGWPADAVQQALDAIRPHGPEHVWRPARPYLLPD
jgi:uncharacterized protein